MTKVLTLLPRLPSSSDNLPVSLLRYCIETAQLAGYEHTLSPSLLHLILDSSPRNFKQIADDAWVESSFLWRCLEKIAHRADAGHVPSETFDRVLHFWTKGFASKEANLRNTLLTQLTMLAEVMPSRVGSQS